MKPTNSANAIPCRCASTAWQLLLKTVFQGPCPVVSMIYDLKSNHVPRILLGSAFQLHCTSINFHINVILCRCIVKIFRSSWLIAKEALVIFKSNRAVTWHVCTADVPSFFCNHCSFVWLNFRWHVLCQPAWCLINVASVPSPWSSCLMSNQLAMWPSLLKLVSCLARVFYPCTANCYF